MLGREIELFLPVVNREEEKSLQSVCFLNMLQWSAKTSVWFYKDVYRRYQKQTLYVHLYLKNKAKG